MDQISYTEKDIRAFETLVSHGPLGRRAIFVFQYLLLRKDFQDFVANIRKEAEIPLNGLVIDDYDSPENVVYSFYRSDHNKRGEFSKKTSSYIESCGVLSHTPSTYLTSFIEWIALEYIVFNDFCGAYKTHFAMFDFETYENMDGTEDQHTPTEIRYYLPVSAKKEEFIAYINETWEELESRRELSDKDSKRFKPRKNFFRDLRILNKYLEVENLTRQERKDQGIVYIDIEVQKRLKEEGMDDVPDDGTIRALVNRLKNDIKDRNSFFKEIEDDEIEELPESPSPDTDDF